MFVAYASLVRVAYLSAIVLAPLFLIENLVQVIRYPTNSLGALATFAVFVFVLGTCALRAWVRIRSGGELIPSRRLRSRWFVAVPLTLLCLLAALAVAAYVYAKWIYDPPMPEGPELLPFLVTVVAYAIALPVGEALLVGRRETERVAPGG